MCGIAGIVVAGGLSVADRHCADRMASALVHRGPDGAGAYDDPSAAIRQRRLAIIDIAGGGQPFIDPETGTAVLYNGEIYNHVELRRDLESRGAVFRSRSDGECILHAWLDAGDEGLHRLHGMFAAALWDPRRRRLLLARDRLGEKPLYLWSDGRRLAFASELKAILASGLTGRSVDPVALVDFLHFGFVPDPATPVLGICKLRPGWKLVAEDAGDRLTIHEEPWWRFSQAPSKPMDGQERLATIGRLVTRSDVPLAVGLSGGIDSSLVAALAVRHAEQPVEAVTIGYAGSPDCDESAVASRFAGELGIRHHRIELADGDFATHLPQVVRRLDDPIADPASFGYDRLMAATRELGFKVILLGQGGDELHWGYSWPLRALADARLRQRPASHQRLAGWRPPCPRGRRGALAWWSRDLAGWRTAFRLRNAFRVPDGDMALWRFAPEWQEIRGGLHGILHPDLAHLRNRDPDGGLRLANPGCEAQAILERMCATYLVENGMAQGDRLSMAHGVEARMPLVDQGFAEDAWRIWADQDPLAGGHKRHIRAAAAAILPGWLMDLPKRGFSPPFRRWLDAAMALHGDRLQHGRLAGLRLIDPRRLAALARGEGRGGILPLAYKLLVFELWLSEVLDG